MFPGKTVENQQKSLTLDLKNRCHLEITGIYYNCSEGYPANLDKIQNSISSKLTKVVNTVITCHDGDCTGCRGNSFACDGNKKDDWWNTSMYLKQHERTNLAMAQNDRQLLKYVYSYTQEGNTAKITSKRKPKLDLNTSTKKNEGLNRGLKVLHYQ